MQPLLIGIAGGTGSGKSTVAAKIAAGLPAEAVAIIDHDSYYRDHSQLDLEARAQLNFDHPEALDNDLLVQQLVELRAGRAVDVPIYDFKSHGRSAEKRHLEPTRILIVEGILVFVEE